MPGGHVLAFDYGLRNIGVCVGQFVTKTASPLTTLRAKNGVPDWSQVAKVISEWQPQMLVVGLPLNMDDTESEMSQRARAFGDELAKRFDVSVEMVDERLSSRSAKEVDDKRSHEIAAVLIAETWLGQSPD